ncbi:hypothetical protein B296_00039776 [Ensete ventricosum]|uniref:Pentacotripeptide-repeat region of PRORP domain-containing protein n=1 Tax=Ensete ventricosum TaxID=4639 RepID=A0A426Y384_ENSVE|nr:hypothetical protein B296_00039776 [Ensete ventricosum]
MIEAWLVKAGLNPVPRGMSCLYVYFVEFCDVTFPFCLIEMFYLVKMKSASGVASRATLLHVIDVLPAPTVEHPTSGIEKRQRVGGEEPLKNKIEVTMPKRLFRDRNSFDIYLRLRWSNWRAPATLSCAKYDSGAGILPNTTAAASTTWRALMRALVVRLPSFFCSTIRDSLFAASPRPFHASSTSSPRLPNPCFQILSFLLQVLSKTPSDPKSFAALDSALAEAHLLDSTASVLLIRALSRCKKLTRAKSVLSGLKQRGTIPDLFLYSLVLQCLLPEALIRDVELVWHDIKGGGADGISGASDFVIGLCRHRVDTSEIEQVYRRVSRSRWSLSRQRYMALIGALCQSSCPNPSLARAVLREMEKGFEADELTYFAIFRSFCRVGNVFEADLVLRGMVHRWNCKLDILIYGNFLYGLCKSGKLREARKLFVKLLKKGQNINHSLIPVLKPGRRVIFQLSSTKLISKSVAFGAYFQSLCKTGRIEEAEMLLKEATEKNIPVETCVYVSFIEALCRAGRAEEAVELLDLEKKKQSVSVGDITVAVIAGLCKLGQVDDGYRLLLDMINRGVSPTAQVCNWILKSYWVAGRMEEAVGLFEKLRAGNCGGCVRPDASTYSLMIHGFLGRGDIVMAVSFIEQMEREKMQVDVGLHSSVVRSLFTSGKLEETQHYMNKMIESGSIASYAAWEEFTNSMTMRIEDIYTLKSVTEMRGP